MTDRPDFDAIREREQAEREQFGGLGYGPDVAHLRAQVDRDRDDRRTLLAEVDRLRGEMNERVASARREGAETMRAKAARTLDGRDRGEWEFAGPDAGRRASYIVRTLPLPDTQPANPSPTGWDAVYEPGNVSSHHIGRHSTMGAAMDAAETWYRDHAGDDPGPLGWERLPEGWRLVDHYDIDTESGIRVRAAGSEDLFLCPSCETHQPLSTSRRRDDFGQRWCWICDEATPDATAEETP